MPAKQERIRVDIWSSLRPVVEAEMERTGLSAQEVVNVALVDYFGLSPKSNKVPISSTEITPQILVEKVSEDEDYI